MVRLIEGHFRGTAELYPEVFIGPAADYSVLDNSSRTMTFTRASAAYDVNGDGVLSEFATNVPRTGVTTRTITNLVTNPRGEFASPPSFPQATLPVSWFFETLQGLTCNVVNSGYDDVRGVPYVDLRVQGIASSTGAILLHPQGSVATPLGTAVTHSVYVALIAGTWANISALTLRNANDVGTVNNITPNSVFQRYTVSVNLTSGAHYHTLRWNTTNTTSSHDFTLRLGGFQTEFASTVGQLTLPPEGTRAVSYSSTPVTNGLLIEQAADNRVPNNLANGFLNGGAHTSVVSTDLPAVYPGATIWKLTKTASADTNFSNMTPGTVAVSTQVVLSAYVWFPLDTTATVAQLGQDSASSTGTGVNYDFARKGTWQRIWRALVTNAVTPNIGYQFRVTGMTETHFCYATLQCVEYGTYPTSAIVTTGTVATRAADQANYSGGDFTALFGGNTRGWIILETTIATGVKTTAVRNLLQIDDGTLSIRYLARIAASSYDVVLYNLPTSSGGVTIGTITPDVPFRIGLIWDNGVGTFVLNGGTASVLPSGSTAARTNLRIGGNGVNTEGVDGRVLNVWAGKTIPDVTTFRTACTTGADVDAIIPQL